MPKDRNNVKLMCHVLQRYEKKFGFKKNERAVSRSYPVFSAMVKDRDDINFLSHF